jgi:hypothetical protein
VSLSNDAREFLRAHIQSLEQLEILAILRSDPEREWTAAAIYERILSSERSIAGRLSQFVDSGLVSTSDSSPPAFRYAPRDPVLDRGAEATLQAYRDRRVLVIETIFRPESDPAQSFSDAFRFKQP